MCTSQSYVFLPIILLLAGTAKVQSKPTTMLRQAHVYLMKFGYLSAVAITNNGTVEENTFRKAVRDFQSFSGLNTTGKLDADTMEQMFLPRCGVPDKARFGHYILGSHWIAKNLTYKILRYPIGFIEDFVDDEIAKAFAVWSKSTVLSFTHKKVGPVHINIKFAIRQHGDMNPFDGAGGSMAHALPPAYGGDIHFDDDELWAIGRPPGVSLFQVAAHEIGHSLGLGHSNVVSSLMSPFYYGYKPDVQLRPDDIMAIENLYGKNNSQSGIPSDFVLPQLAPDDKLCRDPKIDTIFTSIDGQIYAFKGDKYYKISRTALADRYPKFISDGWPGLPGDIDASFTYKTGKTYFFKGTQYWRYSGRRIDNNFPKTIREDFIGLPNHLDAAMSWNDNMYFYKGSQFWSFSLRNKLRIKSGYPKSISIWKGLPNDLDAVIQLAKDFTFYFKGDKYYQVDTATFTVTAAVPPFPRPLHRWWFHCKNVTST